jgi:hypothetical protein
MPQEESQIVSSQFVTQLRRGKGTRPEASGLPGEYSTDFEPQKNDSTPYIGTPKPPLTPSKVIGKLCTVYQRRYKMSLFRHPQNLMKINRKYRIPKQKEKKRKTED